MTVRINHPDVPKLVIYQFWITRADCCKFATRLFYFCNNSAVTTQFINRSSYLHLRCVPTAKAAHSPSIVVKEVMFFSSFCFVCLLTGIRKNATRPIFTKFGGKMALGQRKKRLDFCGNPNHDALWLWLGLRLRLPPTSRTLGLCYV